VQVAEGAGVELALQGGQPSRRVLPEKVKAAEAEVRIGGFGRDRRFGAV